MPKLAATSTFLVTLLVGFHAIAADADVDAPASDTSTDTAAAGPVCEGRSNVRAANGMVTSCAPYACVAGQCSSTCTVDVDCAASFVCDGGKCLATSSECTTDEFGAVLRDGTHVDCRPYKCRPNTGQCGSTCTTVADCAFGTCQNGACGNHPPPPEDDGCSIGGARGARSALGGGAFAIALGAVARFVRRRR